MGRRVNSRYRDLTPIDQQYLVSRLPTTRQGPRALPIVAGIAANASADILDH